MRLSINAFTLRRWLPLLGWPGMLALGLLALAVSFYAFSIRPMQAHLNKLTQTQSTHAIVKTSAIRREANTPGEQLDVFYRFFPKEKQAPDWLGKLVALAEKNGLALNDGQYKMSSDQVGHLARLAITLPVEGKYPQIRKFLTALNHDMPVMALENVQFERKQIADATVRAKIQLVLFMVQES